MSLPEDLLFTKTHEWIREEDGEVIVGITDFAQRQLSDLTYVELPENGEDFEAGAEIASVESVKAASDIYAPLSGTITEVNDALAESPEVINTDPYGDGWLFKMALANPEDLEQLLTPEQYSELLPDDA